MNDESEAKEKVLKIRQLLNDLESYLIEIRSILRGDKT
jgi:hypothetical protein